MLTKKETTKSDPKNGKNTTINSSTPTTPSNSSTEKTPTNLTSSSSTKIDHYSPTTKTQQKTRITVKYDVGFSNQITIRGKGANLAWEKGQPLKNVKADEWVYETDAAFSQIEFKVLLNDRIYEKGENHLLNSGSNIVYTPKL